MPPEAPVRVAVPRPVAPRSNDIRGLGAHEVSFTHYLSRDELQLQLRADAGERIGVIVADAAVIHDLALASRIYPIGASRREDLAILRERLTASGCDSDQEIADLSDLHSLYLDGRYLAVPMAWGLCGSIATPEVAEEARAGNLDLAIKKARRIAVMLPSGDPCYFITGIIHMRRTGARRSSGWGIRPWSEEEEADGTPSRPRPRRRIIDREQIKFIDEVLSYLRLADCKYFTNVEANKAVLAGCDLILGITSRQAAMLGYPATPRFDATARDASRGRFVSAIPLGSWMFMGLNAAIPISMDNPEAARTVLRALRAPGQILTGDAWNTKLSDITSTKSVPLAKLRLRPRMVTLRGPGLADATSQIESCWRRHQAEIRKVSLERDDVPNTSWSSDEALLSRSGG